MVLIISFQFPIIPDYCKDVFRLEQASSLRPRLRVPARHAGDRAGREGRLREVDRKGETLFALPRKSILLRRTHRSRSNLAGIASGFFAFTFCYIMVKQSCITGGSNDGKEPIKKVVISIF